MHRKVYYGCFGTDAPVVYFNFTAFAQNSNVMGNQRALGSLMKSNNWKLLLFSLHSTDLKLRKRFFFTIRLHIGQVVSIEVNVYNCTA